MFCVQPGYRKALTVLISYTNNFYALLWQQLSNVGIDCAGKDQYIMYFNKQGYYFEE